MVTSSFQSHLVKSAWLREPPGHVFTLHPSLSALEPGHMICHAMYQICTVYWLKYYQTNKQTKKIPNTAIQTIVFSTVRRNVCNVTNVQSGDVWAGRLSCSRHLWYVTLHALLMVEAELIKPTPVMMAASSEICLPEGRMCEWAESRAGSTYIFQLTVSHISFLVLLAYIEINTVNSFH